MSNPSSANPTIQQTGNGFVTLKMQQSQGIVQITVSKNIHVGQYSTSGTFISPGPGNTGLLESTNCLKDGGYLGEQETYYYETLKINPQ